MIPRYILPGALSLEPLEQGHLSKLCGVYSIINSLQLALYPQRLTRPELQQVYQLAVNHLARRRQLKRVMGMGIVYETWADLQIELIVHVNRAHGMSLKTSFILTGMAGRDRQRAIHQIKRQVHLGSPVLVAFGGTLEHYSVISGYTDQRLILFDSSKHRWITANKLGLGEGSLRTHWILPHQTVAIADDW